MEDGTPPDHPAFGINISDTTIHTLLRSCIDSKTDEIPTIVRVPHTRSYNNRTIIVYYKDSETPSCVIKVNGRFLGSAKVENEVACLLLLNRFCPQLPVPKILAWYAEGEYFSRKTAQGLFVKSPIEGALKQAEMRGWILMTHLPGSPLDTSTLSTTEMQSLATQISHILLTWRSDVPASSLGGTMHLQARPMSREGETLYYIDPKGPRIYVYGNVQYSNDGGEPSRSVSDYWRSELEWQRTLLATKSTYAANRDPLLGDLQNLIIDVLPKLSVFKDQSTTNPFVFTHTDFFPRNLLVSGSPPTITGIVDYEFAGFFSPMEEFVQDWDPDPIDDGQDWPEEFYGMMMTELERGGDATPRTLHETARKELECLQRIRYFVAPWWMVYDEVSEEREKELERAKTEVKRGITELSALIET